MNNASVTKGGKYTSVSIITDIPCLLEESIVNIVYKFVHSRPLRSHCHMQLKDIYCKGIAVWKVSLVL